MTDANPAAGDGNQLAVRRPGWLTARTCVAAVGLVALAAVILRSAWVCDDAYITLRTVDNFIHGRGLTWNPAERVQAYTHPLWMFLLSGVQLFTREEYLTTIFVSVAAAMAAAAVLVMRFARGVLAAIWMVAVLAMSKSFVDWATSGLENPMTYLLLAVFLWVYLAGEWTRRRLGWLALVAALAGLNRLDALLIVAPPLAYAAWKVGGRKAVVPLLAGMAPLIAWELFALVYYGFPLPNTAYAKLNTAIPRADLALQGLAYLLNCLLRDPLTLALAVAAIVAAIARRNAAYIALAGGIVLQLAYTVWIGGDFMSGRFLSPLVVVGAGVLAVAMPARRAAWLAALVLAVGLGALCSASPLLTDSRFGAMTAYDDKFDWAGIADEREVYYPTTGLLAETATTKPTHEWAEKGRALRAEPPGVVVMENVGFFGYFAGPEHHIIDPFALPDALLAHLPAIGARMAWRVGHYARSLPPGYVESVESGRNLIADPGLAEYYERLLLVTRGNIFSRKRLAEIVRFNLGMNDHLLDAYRSLPMATATWQEVNSAAVEGGTSFGHGGLEVRLDGVHHEQVAVLSLSQGDYYVVYCRDGRPLANGTFDAPADIPPTMAWGAGVPSYAAEAGYDAVRLIPKRGRGQYRLARLHLMHMEGWPKSGGDEILVD